MNFDPRSLLIYFFSGYLAMPILIGLAGSRPIVWLAFSLLPAAIGVGGGIFLLDRLLPPLITLNLPRPQPDEDAQQPPQAA